MAFQGLKYALGAGPNCSWGLGSGPLQKSLGESAHGTTTAININYGDSGLFGVLIAAEAEYAGSILKEALKVLKSGSISDKDAARGNLHLTYIEIFNKGLQKLPRNALLCLVELVKTRLMVKGPAALKTNFTT